VLFPGEVDGQKNNVVWTLEGAGTETLSRDSKTCPDRDPEPEISVNNIAECVAPQGDDMYLGYFGYETASKLDGEQYTATIPAGDGNKVSGSFEFAEGTSLISEFPWPNLYEDRPGRTAFDEPGAFAVLFPGEVDGQKNNVVWTLEGAGTETLSRDSKTCPTPPSVDVDLLKVWVDSDGEWSSDVPTDAGTWNVSVLVGGESILSIPGEESSIASIASIEVGQEYEVEESISGPWSETECPDDVLRPIRIPSDGEIIDLGGDGDLRSAEQVFDVPFEVQFGTGDFTASTDTLHVVCNGPVTVTTSTPRYFLDFDKSWTIDDLSDRVSDLETDGYNASFDVITDADGEETVEVEVDDVTLSAGGQSIAAGNDRRVSLNNDYVLEESFTALDEDLLCTIESTFSYDGEVLEANDDGEVIFTTPASASNNTTFTIDVENEIVCTAVLGEVFESIDIEAVKEWVSVGDDGEQTSIAGPADFTASFAVTVTDEDGEVMATATINDGQVEPFDEEFVDGETYTITWAEIAPPAEFENDGVTLQFNDDASTTAGSVDFVAGDDDSVTLTATNAYDPQPEDPQVDTDTTTTEVEVLGVSVTQDDEEMPKTGASALFLTVLGLLGIGLGGGMLGRFRRTES